MDTLQSILSQTSANPSLRYDPKLISTYQSLGGTLTNGAIPTTSTDPIKPVSKGPAVITTQGVKKDILSPIQEAIKPTVDTSTSSTTTSTTPKLTAEESLLQRELDSQKSSIEKRFENDIASLNAVLDPLKTQLNANKQAQIDSIKSKYSLLRTQLEESNARRNKLQETIGIRFGGRFTPEHTADLVQDQVNQGVQAIQELNSQEQDSISIINSAFDEKSYTLAVKEFEKLQEIRKERDEKLANIEKAQVDGLKALQEQNRIATVQSIVGNLFKQGLKDPVDILNTINSFGVNTSTKELKEMLDLFNVENPELEAIGDLRKTAINNGASPEIVDAISNAKTFGEAFNIAGKFGRGGTGIIGEYNLAVAGGYTGTPDEYMTADANRKRQVVNLNAGGLTSQENQSFLGITNKYQADSIVNAAIKAGQIRTLADQIIANPELATNQLASLYIFVKNLDPDSAVREGELSLANQTQSYLQTYKNSLARLQEGRVVSPEAAKALAEATKKLVATWEDTAKRKTNLYKSQARNSSPNVGNAFDSYVSDYNELNTLQDTIQDSKNAKSKVDTFVTTNPSHANTIATLYEQGLTDMEVVEYLTVKGLIKQ